MIWMPLRGSRLNHEDERRPGGIEQLLLTSSPVVFDRLAHLDQACYQLRQERKP